jgi:AraC family transcriptional regulator
MYVPTKIRFWNADTGGEDRCGEPLRIEQSSDGLGWLGAHLEKGWSPHFYPTNVTTREFYFAMDLATVFHWEARRGHEMQQLVTEPGDIWVNPPGSPFTHVVDEPCRFVILTIEPAVMFRDVPKNDVAERLRFLTSYNIRDAVLASFMETLYAEVERGGTSGLAFVDHVLRAFCEYYVRHYSNLRDLTETSNTGRITSAEIDATRQFFLTHLDQTVNIEAAASRLNMSKFHFLKEFKKARGETPYQYLLRLKSERAAELLRYDEMALSDIAQALGFSDQSHFSNFFKRHHGVSPGHFRRNAATSDGINHNRTLR